jgi:hypothetical protein
LWRRRHHALRDSNLYPTHGLGPLANYMGINRGDKFEYLVAMSSGHWGLETYRKEHLAAEDPRQKEVYRCGDYNTSLIKTARGRSVMLQHNVSTPRPYDRINLIQGTKGIFRDYPSRLFLDGQEGEHAWQGTDKFKATYEHELWRREGERAHAGHGRLRRGLLERARPAERDIRRQGLRAGQIPGLYTRALGAGAQVRAVTRCTAPTLGRSRLCKLSKPFTFKVAVQVQMFARRSVTKCEVFAAFALRAGDGQFGALVMEMTS